MALYEEMSSKRTAGWFGQGSARCRIPEVIRMGLVALLVGLWIAGAYAGIVYWSLQGSLLGVLASTVVSLAAGAATWSLFVKLGDPDGR